jgi:CBS domain-containing protein
MSIYVLCMKGHARHLMTEPVISVGADTSVVDVGRMLVTRAVSGFPVVDDDERVIGFVNETDILVPLLRNEIDKTASDVMSRPPIVVDEFTPTDAVMSVLQQSHIHHLPVVREGRLVGIITPRDVLRYLIERVIPPPPQSA